MWFIHPFTNAHGGLLCARPVMNAEGEQSRVKAWEQWPYSTLDTGPWTVGLGCPRAASPRPAGPMVAFTSTLTGAATTGWPAVELGCGCHGVCIIVTAS